MTIDDQTAWNEFRVDLLKSKFQGAPTETELIDRLNALLKRRNPFAIRAANLAKLINDPDGNIVPNRVWEIGAIYGLADVQMPTQTGPAGTDNFGLWRDDHGNRKK
jgi:hypothetical protein